MENFCSMVEISIVLLKSLILKKMFILSNKFVILHSWYGGRDTVHVRDQRENCHSWCDLKISKAWRLQGKNVDRIIKNCEMKANYWFISQVSFERIECGQSGAYEKFGKLCRRNLKQLFLCQASTSWWEAIPNAYKWNILQENELLDAK